MFFCLSFFSTLGCLINPTIAVQIETIYRGNVFFCNDVRLISTQNFKFAFSFKEETGYDGS